MTTPEHTHRMPLDPDYDRIVRDLAYRYDGVFSTATVERAVADAHDLLAPTARIHTYLPVLVERFARDQLLAAAQAEGTIAKSTPEVLFVCVHNAGRSQLAAALMHHLSGGHVHVRSAGSAPTGEINPLVIEVLHERGIELTEAFPKPLTDSVVRAADAIVTMGCGDACPVYPGKRYLDWTVTDPAALSLDAVRAIRDDIENRVTILLAELVPAT